MFILLKTKKFEIFHQFASHSKVVHSEDHFSEGLFRSRFSKSSYKFKRKWTVRVLSHASVSKSRGVLPEKLGGGVRPAS